MRLGERLQQVSTQARFLKRSGLLRVLGPSGWREMIRASRHPGPDGLYRIHAKNTPDKVALVDGDRSWTYGELDHAIDRVAGGLAERGLGRGSAGALALGNRAEMLVAQTALQRVGAAAVSISWRSTPEEIAYLLRDSGARILFFEADLADTVRAARAKLGPDALPESALVAVGDRVPGLAAFGDLLASRPWRSGAVRGASVVIYTSGTTGKPKGAVRKWSRGTMDMVLSFVAETPFAHDERHLVVCPLYHSAAFAFVSMTMLVGGTAILSRDFDPYAFVDTVARERVTSAVLVPTMLHRLLALPKEDLARARWESLRAVFSAAAPLPPPLATAALGTLGPVLFNFYGATETGLVTLATPADLAARPDTVGRALPGNQIRLLGDDGLEVGPGDVGELFVKNATSIAGYHANEAATIESQRAGFWSVGDLARRDDEGRYYVVGRKRDMIISGGVNVYPREVEIALEGHPSVAEASVVGVEDAEWGERVRAFVVAAAGCAREAEPILAHCRALLARPKVPKEIVFLERLPRNATGKVLKTELRAWREDERW